MDLEAVCSKEVGCSFALLSGNAHTSAHRATCAQAATDTRESRWQHVQCYGIEKSLPEQSVLSQRWEVEVTGTKTRLVLKLPSLIISVEKPRKHMAQPGRPSLPWALILYERRFRERKGWSHQNHFHTSHLFNKFTCKTQMWKKAFPAYGTSQTMFQVENYFEVVNSATIHRRNLSIEAAKASTSIMLITINCPR